MRRQPDEGLSSLKANRSVERALQVLLTFVGGDSNLRAHQIAARTGLNRTTVLRLLLTMERYGFVSRSPRSEGYCIGPRLVELVGAFVADSDLIRLAHPEMVALRDLTGETVSLMVPEGLDRICIFQVESQQDVRRSVRLGQRVPLFTGASGRVLVAFGPPHLEQRVVAALEATGAGPDRVAWFREQVAAARVEGFAISIDERGQGVAALAVPVRNRLGVAVAAISIGGPVSRLTPKRLRAWAPAAMAAARRLGHIQELCGQKR